MDKEQLRNHYAGMAMQAMLSKSLITDNPKYFEPELKKLCENSFYIADIMLNASIERKYVHTSYDDKVRKVVDRVIID